MLKCPCFISIFLHCNLKKLGSNPTLSRVKPHRLYRFLMKTRVKPHTLSTPLVPLCKGEDAMFLSNGEVSSLTDPSRENL